MTALTEVLDTRLLAEMLAAGYVRRQQHPTLPLSIYNYSEKAQYERCWNDVTRQCRGLIVDDRSGEVRARPFRKFFNHDETGVDPIDGAQPVVVTDKMDGSLGILYWADTEYQVSTRGSFASDQATHATKLWRERYAGHLAVPQGWTMLFEIIYPENRIVLDYRGLDNLVLLGACEIATGRTVTPADAVEISGWFGPVVQTMTYTTLVDALAAEPRPDAEGLVVHSLATDRRLKLKQADYVRLHRIVTGLSNRTVWEHLGDGKPLEELLEPLPEEFHTWVRGVADGLRQHAASIEADGRRAYDEVVAGLPADWSRKDFAMAAKERPERGLLFLLLDGKQLGDTIWRAIKPERATLPPGMAEQIEEAA